MSDEPIDLGPLHPSVDALARALATRCEPLLAARREHVTTVELARWWRPALAASLLVAAASVVVLALPFQEASRSTEGSVAARRATSPRVQLAMAVGIPRPLARHLTNRTPPSLSALLEMRR